jgi:hypothetical protein
MSYNRKNNNNVKRWLRWASLLSAALTTLVSAWVTPVRAELQREPDLLKVARRLPGKPLWIPTGTHDFFEYCLAPGNKALIFKGHMPGTLHVIELDLRTGRQRPIKRLGRGLVGEPVTRHNMLDPLALSSNGRTLTCCYDAVPGPGRYEDLYLGSRQKHAYNLTIDEIFDAHWLPDSKDWFCWDPWTTRVIEYSLRSYAPKYIVPKGLPSPVQNKNYGDGVGQVVGVTSDGDVLLLTGSLGEVGATFILYKLPLRNGGVAVRMGRFHYPDNLVLRDVKVSPSGNRLALQLEANDTSEWQKVSIWTCDFDGRHMTEIGATHIDLSDSTPSILWNMSGLQWTSDGKNLVFMNKNTLWTTPAQ